MSIRAEYIPISGRGGVRLFWRGRVKAGLALAVAAALLMVWSLSAFGAGGGRAIDIGPLWKVAIITDTQTRDCERIGALIGGLKAERPKMVVHTGDAHFDWGDRCTLKAVVDLLRIESGGLEFHLAPGNHDVSGGVLKLHLRAAATRGVYDLGPAFAGEGASGYASGIQWPVWNAEVVDHPGWQVSVNGGPARWRRPNKPCRYVFKRGGIRFIVCDPFYSREQHEWLAGVLSRPDDSSVSIMLHHAHNVGRMAKYFEGLEGRHNVRLVLSGHDHRYRHEVRDGITYITGAGIAHGGECDVMILRVHRRYLLLDRYIVDAGGASGAVRGPEPIWMCEGRFSEYRRPESPRGIYRQIGDLARSGGEKGDLSRIP